MALHVRIHHRNKFGTEKLLLPSVLLTTHIPYPYCKSFSNCRTIEIFQWIDAQIELSSIGNDKLRPMDSSCTGYSILYIG